MKKFLSLVLALVMTMSLVTISAGAKDFTDTDKVTYTEAVDVLSAVKVIDGYTDGSFKPQTPLNRGQAAKIICNLILGPTTAAALKADAAPFKDVPADSTFAGYITYCAKEGIISGYTDGTFKAGNPLTGYAFMKMLLGALGYDADVEGYNNPTSWSISVAKQAIAIGLEDGLVEDFDGRKTVTREEACLYALNTLKATMVDYESKTTVTVAGAEVVIAGSKAQDVKWNIASKANGNIKGDDYVQFAEKYFPKLELEVGRGTYGRPANTWKESKKEIGTYTSIQPTVVYTKATDSQDIYKDLGKTVCDAKEYEWVAYKNGKLVTAAFDLPKKGVDKTYDEGFKFTADGTVCEIYVNDDENTVDVISFDYYLGQVTKTGKDDDGEYAKVKVFEFGSKYDTVVYTEDCEVDEYLVVTFDYDDEDKVYDIASIAEPETAEGTVTLVRKWTVAEDAPTYRGEYLKLDDTKYNYSEFNTGDLDDVETPYPTLDTEYKLYLDPNGFVIGFVALEDISHNFLYVEDSDVYMSTAEAKVVFADGTEKVIKLDKKYSDGTEKVVDDADNHGLKNKVFGYTVDGEKYTLIKLPILRTVDTDKYDTPAAGEETIKNGVAFITVGGTTYIVDENTVFVDVKNTTTYTGFKDVPNWTEAKFWVIDRKNDDVADIIFVYEGEKYDENTVFFWVKKAADFVSYNKDKTVAEQTCYVNGEKTTVKIKYTERNAKIDAAGLYQVKKTNSDGVATEIVKVANGFEVAGGIKLDNAGLKKFVALSVGKGSFWTTQNATLKNAQWIVDDETIFVVVDADGDVREGTLKDVEVNKAGLVPGDDYTYVTVIKSASDNKIARLVYIVQTVMPGYSLTVTEDNATVSELEINGKAAPADLSKVELFDGDVITFKAVANTGYENLVVSAGRYGTEVGDGAYSLTVSDEYGDVAITASATKAPEKKTYALTLTGTLAGDNVKVYNENGTVEYQADPSKTVYAFGKPVSKTYNIPVVAPAVMALAEEEAPIEVKVAIVILDNNGDVESQFKLTMTGNETLDDNDLAIANGEKVAITVDGKTTYIAKNAEGEAAKVPAANGRYLVDDVKNAYSAGTVRVTDGKLTVSDTSKGHEYFVACAISDEIPAEVDAKYGDEDVKSFIAKGETIELIFTTDDKSYAVKIDGEVVAKYEDVKADDKATVKVTGYVEVVEIQSEKQFKADVAEKVSGVETKKDTENKYELTVNGNTATLVIEKEGTVRGTGMGTAAAQLLTAGYTVKVGSVRLTEDNAIEDGHLNGDALAALAALVPTVDAFASENATVVLPITVTNADGVVENFTLTITQKV